MSRALAELGAVGLVRCLTPERRKGRLYAVDAGASVELALAGMEEAPPLRRPRRAVRGTFAPKCRGEALQAGLAAASELVGPRGVQRLSRRLGVDFTALQADAWYPIALHHRLLSHLRRMPEADGIRTCEEVGRRSIAYLPHLERFLTRRLGVTAVMERIPLVHGHYFNFGRFEVGVDGARLEVRQVDMLPTVAFCAARRGNYEGVFRAIGYRAKVAETTCGARGHEACTYRIDLTPGHPSGARRGRGRAGKPYGSPGHGGQR